jgi:hypothetical protein
MQAELDLDLGVDSGVYFPVSGPLKSQADWEVNYDLVIASSRY